MPSFPAYMPDCCPPADASDAAGKVFRIVRHNPATADDFKTHTEKGTARSADACERAGVSVFLTHRQACHRLRLSPHLGTMIAAGTLTPTHGKMHVNKPEAGHANWWPYEGVVRHQPFTEYQPCP